MALGSTQPLTEMSTRNLPGGKGRPARKANDLNAVSRLYRKCGSLDVSQPYGPSRPVTRIAFPLPFILKRLSDFKLFLGCDDLWSGGCLQTFRTSVLLRSSGPSQKTVIFIVTCVRTSNPTIRLSNIFNYSLVNLYSLP
jgi:hypothetical protein